MFATSTSEKWIEEVYRFTNMYDEIGEACMRLRLVD